jgi:hypothetical protein
MPATHSLAPQGGGERKHDGADKNAKESHQFHAAEGAHQDPDKAELSRPADE